MQTNVDKVKVVKAIISKVENEKKPYRIEVKDLNEYKTPEKILYRDKADGVIPDVVVYYKEKVDLYEVELKDESSLLKWNLMSLHAKSKKGHLFVVVPDYLKENVKNELISNNLNAGLMYFDTNR